MFYSALPTLEQSKCNWHSLFNGFYDKFQHCDKVFWTQGKWINFTESFFLAEDVSGELKDCLDDVRKFLQQSSIHLVQIPVPLMETVKQKLSHRINSLGPSYLRSLLKGYSFILNNQNFQVKMNLLSYCLSDKQYHDMTNIPLLPLDNGNFEVFDSQRTAVFIDSKDHPKTILMPGFKGRFLCDKTPKAIKETIIEILEQQWGQQFSQLKILNKNVFAENVRTALPNNQLTTWNPSSENPPNQEWLRTIWKYLNDYFPNLRQFEKLPILPIIKNQTFCLTMLSKDSNIIFDNCGLLSKDIKDSLEKSFGVIYLQEVQVYHSQLSDFFYGPNPQSILELLSSKQAAISFSSFPLALREKWNQFFSNLTVLKSHEKIFLRSLPIFKFVTKCNTRATSRDPITSGSCLIEPVELRYDPLPQSITYPVPMVSCHEKELAMLVNCQALTLEDFLQQVLLKPVNFGRFTRRQKIDLGKWIAERLRLFSSAMLSYISTLFFVPCSTDQLEAPCNLFDPQNQKLCQLFCQEDKFPVKEFVNHEIVGCLKTLGLKDSPSIADILKSAKSLNTLSLTEKDAIKKSDAILFWLEYLVSQRKVTPRDVDELKRIPFLQILHASPDDHPQNLAWYGSSFNGNFASPAACFPITSSNVVCSVCLICSQIMSADVISLLFGQNKDMQIEKVYIHAKNLSKLDLNVQNARQKKKHLEMTEEFLAFFNERFEESNFQEAAQFLKTFPCIWNGIGFSMPSNMMIKAQDFSLKPYIHEVPDQLKQFNEMLLAIGVKDSLTIEDLLAVIQAIKTHHEKKTVELSKARVKSDLKLSIEILKKVGQVIDKLDNKTKLVIPIQSPKHNLVFMPMKMCVYHDRMDSKSMHEGISVGGNVKPFVIHEDIPWSLAEKIGVKSLTRSLVKADNFGFEECGQYEDLTRRIRNILDEYSDEVGIFKELIQNADDAKATEICFVIDMRTNEDSNQSGLLDPEMSACQGSALWAYNNSTFTESDFVNIQKLGSQTKEDIQGKIGHFGIGFNSVYHITDVPSFVSGNDIVFFDPHQTHLKSHLAQNKRPGIKIDFVENENLELFCNQFKPYNGMFNCQMTQTKSQGIQSFPGTLFRLPFRTKLSKLGSSQKQMSEKIFDTERIEKLESVLKESADTLLLFTKNITKVKLFKIPASVSNPKNMEEMLCIERDKVRIPHSPLHSLEDFFKKSNTNLDQNKDLQNEETPISSLIKMSIKKKQGPKCVNFWMASSSEGGQDALEMANSEDGKKMRLQPHGEVACLLSLDKDGNVFPAKVEGEAFCFLPISIRTGLPVHINASFAIHSNRRSIWNSKLNPKTLWNEILMKDVISLSYLSLLKNLQSFLPKEPKEQLHTAPNRRRSHQLLLLESPKPMDKWLSEYKTIFPSHNVSNTTVNQFEQVSQGAYQKMSKMETKLFPVIHQISKDKSKLLWFPPVFNGTLSAVFFGPIFQGFGPYSSNTDLRNLLIDLGFNLIDERFNIMSSYFESLDITVKKSSPQEVIEFLKASKNQDYSCKLKNSLPCQLNATPIRNEKRLELLLKYCLQMVDIEREAEKKWKSQNSGNNLSLGPTTEFKSNFTLEDLPLLLTSDGTLRTFEKEMIPILATSYLDLLPDSPELFLHKEMKSIFVEGKYAKAYSGEFVVQMELFHLAEYHFICQKYTNNKEWLCTFWKFVSEKTQEMSANKIIELFCDWQVFPVFYCASKNHRNIFLGEAKFAIMNHEEKDNELYDLLTKMDYPVFSGNTFDKESYKEQKKDLKSDKKLVEFVCQFASSLLEPKALLEVLNGPHSTLQTISQFDQGHLTILSAIQHNRRMGQQEIEQVKKLPLFEDICHNLRSLQPHCDNVKIILEQIPKEGIAIWTTNSSDIFLVEHKEIELLYKRLGVTYISSLEIYPSHIIPCFCKMEEKDIFCHLAYLKKKLEGLNSNKKIKVEILEKLNRTPLFSKTLLTSAFFNPQSEIFKTFVPEEILPLSHIEKFGIDFLSEVGLQTTITENLFVQFANDLATQPNFNRTQEASKLLLEFLINSEDLKTEPVLTAISTTTFVSLGEVKADLEELHSQHRPSTLICFRNSIPQSEAALVWTSANLLPELSSKFNEKELRWLGICQQPSLHVVLEHITTLCSSLSLKENDRQELDLSSEGKNCLVNVIHCVFKFLQGNFPDDSEMHAVLKQLQCVPVDGGNFLVFPTQIATNINSNNQIFPFLFSLPNEFGDLNQFIVTIGAEEEAQPMQFAKILSTIFNRNGESKLTNDLKAAENAVKGVIDWLIVKKFEKCENDNLLEAFHDISELHILTLQNSLQKSSDLILVDRPSWKKRIQLLSLPKIKKEIMDSQLSKMLPSHLRPLLLSTCFQEKLGGNCNEECDESTCLLKHCFKKKLSHPEVLKGIMRIANHNFPLTERKVEEIKEAIQGLTIMCLPKIYTNLLNLQTEEMLEQSEKKVDNFISEEGHFCFDHNIQLHTLVDNLSTHLIEILPDCIEKGDQNHLQAILNCRNPFQIAEVLDDRDISECTISSIPNLNLLPGTPIGQNLLCYLKQDPSNIFQIGDIVAVELRNDEKMSDSQNTSIFLLAVIEEKLLSKFDHLAFNLGRRFLVNIGQEEQLEASCDLLYEIMFDKLECSTVSESQDPVKIENLDVKINLAKNKIMGILDTSEQLPESERQKVSQRLYLEWHPDKNSDNFDVCEEAFKFLSTQLEGKLDKLTVEDGMSSNLATNLFDQWNTEANSLSLARSSNYKNQLTFHEEISSPNPIEACRWMKQARADLDAAENLIKYHHPEWTCMMCQQSVEKILKAVLFLNGSQLDHTHSLKSLASEVESKESSLKMIASLASSLDSIGLGYGTLLNRARYPNTHSPSKIPHTAFTSEDSQEAFCLAKEIFKKCKSFLEKNNVDF